MSPSFSEFYDSMTIPYNTQEFNGTIEGASKMLDALNDVDASPDAAGIVFLTTRITRPVDASYLPGSFGPSEFIHYIMSAGEIKGYCNCGQYQITISSKPKGMNLCHCIDCRRWSGAMYSAHIFADKEHLTIEGPEPRTYEVKGIKGKRMTRAWCDTCGSGLWIKPEGEDQVFVKAGLFDPGDVPNPTLETFTKDMEKWEKTAPGVEPWKENHGGI